MSPSICCKEMLDDTAEHPCQAMLKLEATIAGFKAEVLKTQELHLASLTRDTERLQNDSDKIRAELK